MDRRREELRTWFAAHPRGTPMQAVRDLGYSYPDHMRVVADSVLMDLVRAEPGPLHGASTLAASLCGDGAPWAQPGGLSQAWGGVCS
jgi:hypothetical protein